MLACASSHLAQLVEQLTDEGDIIVDILACETWKVGEASKSRDSREDGVCLRASIARKSVIPEGLERASYRRLFMIVVTMSSYQSREAESKDTWTWHC